MRRLRRCRRLRLLLAACSGGGGTFVASAKFGDVGDLAQDAPVMMADIVVGKVTDIRLVGHEPGPREHGARKDRRGAAGRAGARQAHERPGRDAPISCRPKMSMTTSPLLADGDEITGHGDGSILRTSSRRAPMSWPRYPHPSWPS